MDPTQLPSRDLPEGVTSRYVDTSPVGLKSHVLESFPDAASPSRLPPLLAEAGYYAVAFDMRGFGRTHNADLNSISESSFRRMTALRDVVTLVHALGYEISHTLVGHDIGAFVASLCALVRGDMIKSLVLMSHPFKVSPQLPFGTAISPLLASAASNGAGFGKGEGIKADPDIRSSLLKLDPPRGPGSIATAEEWTNPTGEPMRRFLRALNKPGPLASWTAEQLAVMPHYYVMRTQLSMRGNVDLDMSDEPAEIRDRLGETRWLTDADLQVYTDEFSRNTFGPPLLWYKVLVDPSLSADPLCFAGTKIGIPTKYGTSDWGTYQVPGSLDAMGNGESVRDGCWKRATHIPGAGHWVNMEKPEERVKEILELARSV
ncbi:Alpha/Beta hydrolase protein [Colletotrichum navitas]|uniref:Alpha/Beta hydrolase protein n=1 Tax=Colletotrichum navitas TaxID=681940 RepID=A0AAD8PKM2_9PEZI|nr:Alpha/Beta hydrolase protein [Colletotrichum navitas]KAK1569405.1 Alpha/Beta hydrolase protein [Colletotrichum navitas]